MKKFFKYSALLIILAIHLCLAVAVNFFMPSYADLNITGVEVKRVDKDGPLSQSNPADGPTRDVYYIYTRNPENQKVMVYKNEDTRFSFPFYFKFNSANTQALAQAMSNDKSLAQVKYYGWRVTMFDKFPNVIKLTKIDSPSELSKPYISYILYVLVLLSFIWFFQLVRGWFDADKIELK